MGGTKGRLVDVGSGVYRVAIENGAFLKFEFVGDYWKVTDKAGSEFYFGESSNSRMENPNWGPQFTSTPLRTFRWALNRVRDVNGNETTVTYTFDGNQIYPSQVSYNANVNTPTISATHTISFTLEDRADKTISFLSGYRVTTAKRLKEIQVKINTTNVRKYALSYTYSPSTYRSLLSAVTQYGSDFSSTLPSLKFTYQVKPFEFDTLTDWTGLYSQGETDSSWNSIRSVDSNKRTKLDFVDIDGDGFPDPDRVLRKLASPYTNFVVQVASGVNGTSSFSDPFNWLSVTNESSATDAQWGAIRDKSSGDTRVDFLDINGDGLPDRVMRKLNTPYDRFAVQFNNGAGFEAWEYWGGTIDNQGQSGNGWKSPVGTDGNEVFSTLADINGDGLLDRVMRKATSSYDRFKVQLNKGPFPDLLSVIENSIGGKVQISYTASTKYDNRDRPWAGNPWDANARSLLPYPVWTVSSIIMHDGFGNADANTYHYAGGVGSPSAFAGFSRVTMTDPRGTKTITFFQQGGGTNDTINGEFEDEGSVAKVGMPYRVELWGSDGLKDKQTLSKVEQVQLHTNGWYFPFVSQTIELDYEGLSSYRATARQFFYDAASNVVTSTGNLTNEVNFGEVSSVTVSNHAFTNIGSDSLFTRTAYNSLGKPTNVTVFADSGGTAKLRESRFTYDARGNLTARLDWLNTSNSYVTNSIGYDQYGNVTSTTNPVGIVTRTIYDTTYQTFPVTQITATFTNQNTFDARSGQIVTSTDVKGLVSSNAFDVFYRLKESWISTNAFATPVLWRMKLDYNLGGVGGGISTNYVRRRVFDAVDLTDGHQTYIYFDGLGRTTQTRVEAETGQYRVTDTFYDERGNPEFVTLPYFSSGTAFTSGGINQLGTLTEYDAIGRPFRTTSPANSAGQAQGDTGSPVGSTTIAYKDATTLWTTITTDPENKVRKAARDAYGRVVQIIEPGDINTYYRYDKVGNLTNVTDNAGNDTWMNYDSLGRKTSMTEPNMGTWSYAYDAASRVTEQTDAKNQRLKFIYNDPIGRLTAKEVYHSTGLLVATITYTYDTSDDPNYTVFKGQLYKVTDREGWQKNSYDVRGRVLKTGRYLTVNNQTYVTQSTYDDADRVSEVTYPANATRIKYTYDPGGNVKKVESLCGTGANETFYQLGGLTALGQIGSYTNGNGVVTTNAYYANSKRLKQIVSNKGSTTFQSLTYTWEKRALVTSISDAIYSGTASASLSGITYDDVQRLTSYTRFGNPSTFTYTANGIGNINVNPEFGGGAYTYGSSKPHAVISANGKTYAYDACGNMTNRNGWALSYDEENQLTQIIGTNTVTFGYADGGQRLWKYSGGQYTIYIGGIYELKAGKTLCHVFAGGQRIATFEPQSPFCAFLRTNPVVSPVVACLEWLGTWPFQQGRTPLTVMLLSLVGILCASVGSRWRATLRRGRAAAVVCRSDLPVATAACEFGSGLQRRYARLPLRAYSFWMQLVSVILIAALLLAVTPTKVEAGQCIPVFWYYHSDHLGSSSVMTDRNGDYVDHYEYYAFGKERYNDPSCDFNVSNRYTGQILDEETGLYYYNARYGACPERRRRDPEIGRFIQPDTIVPTAADPQRLNRYSYCGDNPLNNTDPSGHDPLTVAIIIVVVAVVVNVAVAAATGGDIGKAALAGFIGGVVGGFIASIALSSVAATLGPVATGAIVGAVGGAAGGAASAAVSGGDVGMAALTGAVGGAIGGAASGWTANWGNTGSAIAARAAVTICSGALAGGVTAAISGGNIWQGMAIGAAGAAVAFAATVAMSGNGDTVAEEVKEDHAATAGAEEAGVSSVANSGYGDVIPVGRSSVNATFWAAIGKGDLATAAEALFAAQQIGSATPAMVRALEVAQKAAELLPRIIIKAHGFREGRLGSLTVDNARKAIANVIARGEIKLWEQAGQQVFAGQFAQGRQIYSFTGSLRPGGTVEVGTVVRGVHRLSQ